MQDDELTLNQRPGELRGRARESEVNLLEGPGLQDKVDSLAYIHPSQGQTMNFNEFVALAPLLPSGSFFFL